MRHLTDRILCRQLRASIKFLMKAPAWQQASPWRRTQILWWTARLAIDNARFTLAAAIMNRVATRDMRFAAFLVGEQLGLGHGSGRGLLSYLHEYTVGDEIGCEIKYACQVNDGGRLGAATEVRMLETAAFFPSEPKREIRA
jgi:hypothetical protein